MTRRVRVLMKSPSLIYRDTFTEKYMIKITINSQLKTEKLFNKIGC
jgi:hypothetical protein